jgi:serine protease Do
MDNGEAEDIEIFGSGFIIDEEGHVVTNNHVAEKTTSIRCILYDKTELPATVVGLDPETDLAVLKLDLSHYDKKLSVAALGSSAALSEGDFVMALGAPLGFSRSVSLGVVSNKERYFEQSPYTLWIQTDAAVNPGNSGGPLVNLKGEVVGINSRAIMGANSLGFAIPIDEARVIVDKLIRDKAVVRTWTGLWMQELESFSASNLIKAKEGVLVAGVSADSPAAKAGVEPGDIILTCNGQKVTCRYEQELPATSRFFTSLPLDRPSELVLLRGDKQMTVSLAPEKQDKANGEQFDCKSWGMTVQEINKLLPAFIIRFRDHGVFVLGLKYEHNAQRGGIQSGDIIVKINGAEINSIKDMKAAYEKADRLEKGARTALVEVLRHGYTTFIVIDFNEEPKLEEGSMP